MAYGAIDVKVYEYKGTCLDDCCFSTQHCLFYVRRSVIAVYYDRSAIAEGELWRIFSSHFVHFSNLHLLYNAVVFGISGWLIEQKGYPCFGGLILLMALCIGAVLLAMKPEMVFYGGLSGLAHGAFFYLALFGLYESYPWRRICLLAIVAVLVKVTVEWYLEASLVIVPVHQEFVPMPVSHLTGVVTALCFFLLVQYRTVLKA